MNPYLELCRLILASIFGAVAGHFAAHRFTKARDKESRRREFLAFLVPWRTAIDDSYRDFMTTAMDNSRPYYYWVYQRGLTDFLAASELAKDACRNINRFELLTSRVAGLKEDHANEHAKTKTLQALDELIAHVKEG
jgi:hypothetical protein